MQLETVYVYVYMHVGVHFYRPPHISPPPPQKKQGGKKGYRASQEYLQAYRLPTVLDIIASR